MRSSKQLVLSIMNKKKTTELGTLAENMAAAFLEKKGFQILERNWRYGHKEIDLITRKGNTLHIVEVKSRKDHLVQNPFEAVTKTKQHHLIDAAEAYILQHNIDDETVFDIVSIVDEKIIFIEDAFQAEF